MRPKRRRGRNPPYAFQAWEGAWCAVKRTTYHAGRWHLKHTCAIILNTGGVAESVYAADLKSVDFIILRVQVPPPPM